MTQVAEQSREVRIGDYIVTGKIGQGGIAEIFRGRQESLGRDVAIKILFPELCEDSEILRRFERESVVIARLSHPNIVHVIDKGKAGNRYYFVMEYVDGTSMREIIDSDSIPRRTKLEMLAHVCKALDYAHKNGVIHRDIKPANILVDRQGNPRVADFGIAQMIGTPDTEVTASDIIMGTLAYMSPEQKVSSTNVDQTTDIYAVGVIIYEILVGRKPHGRFQLPSEIDSSITTSYDLLVQRCLASEPKDRFQTAAELKDALLNLIGGATSEKKALDYAVADVESFVGNCQYLDTIKETRYTSTILVENKVSNKLFVIKKHSRGEAGKMEARKLSSLKHKNIVNILGSGGTARDTVIVLEYARGGSLAERMVRKYDWEKAMQIGLQIASGLDFAHRHSIVHGNLRPSNILFDANDTVKVADFGLPVHYDLRGKKNWYNPPEKKASRQGDIYAAGVILHQMIAGRNPTYDTAGNLRLDDIAGQVPDEVRTILTHLLAFRVGRRYKSFEEMILEYEAFEAHRQVVNRRLEQPVASGPKPEAKSGIPVWVYMAIAAGVGGIALIILFMTGVFG